MILVENKIDENHNLLKIQIDMTATCDQNRSQVGSLHAKFGTSIQNKKQLLNLTQNRNKQGNLRTIYTIAPSLVTLTQKHCG